MPEERTAQLRSILAADAFARLVGVRLDAAETDAATLSLAWREDLRQPTGLLHGGVYAVLADTAVVHALGTTLRASFSLVTVRLDTSYFEPVRAGRLTARAHVVRKGRRLAHVEVELARDDGRLVAIAASIVALTPHRAHGHSESAGRAGEDFSSKERYP